MRTGDGPGVVSGGQHRRRREQWQTTFVIIFAADVSFTNEVSKYRIHTTIKRGRILQSNRATMTVTSNQLQSICRGLGVLCGDISSNTHGFGCTRTVLKLYCLRR